MIISPDLWLILGILAFYLYDGSILLHVNEIVFVRSSRGWKSRILRSDWQLQGKNLLLANPITSAHVLFPVTWSGFEKIALKDGAHTMAQFLEAIRPIQLIVTLLTFILFVPLPIVLILSGHGSILLAVVVSIYAIVIIAVSYIYRHRGRLGISTTDVRSIALDSIACPPFALNMVQKICVKRGIHGDALDVAKILMSADEFDRLLSDLAEKIETVLRTEEEGSEFFQRLIRVQHRLQEFKT